MHLLTISNIEYKTVRLATVINYAVLIFAIIVMGIWIIAPSIFNTILPQSATMKFNTALLFALCAIFLIRYRQLSRTSNRRLTYLSLVIIGLAGITFLATVLKIPLFLDELIAGDPLTAPDDFPGRMSQMTAFLFILMGGAFLFIERYSRMVEQLAVVINLISVGSLFAFLFDFEALYALYFFETVSVFTALSFVILSTLLVLSLPDGVIRNLVISDTPAGIAARRLLPMALLIPTALGWIILEGMRFDIYEPSFAIVLIVMLTITLQLIMVMLYTITLKHWYEEHQIMQQREIDREIERIELENFRELNRMKEEFVAQLSHDMRSPLSSIILSSEIIMEHQDRLTQERRIRHLQQIKYQAHNLLNFVDEMLLINQFEFDSLPFVPEIDNIVAYCQGFYNMFTQYYELEEHNFVLDVPDKAIYLNFDPRLLERMLNNLVSNAIKYSPDGGKITLRIQKDTECTYLSVQDEGIGIPEKNIVSLYDMFQRADNIGDIRGYGLGLTIVKKVVDIHDATIVVDSEVGRGTTFKVSFKNRPPKQISSVL